MVPLFFFPLFLEYGQCFANSLLISLRFPCSWLGYAQSFGLSISSRKEEQAMHRYRIVLTWVTFKPVKQLRKYRISL